LQRQVLNMSSTQIYIPNYSRKYKSELHWVSVIGSDDNVSTNNFHSEKNYNRGYLRRGPQIRRYVNPEARESTNPRLISFDWGLTQVCLVCSNVYIDRSKILMTTAWIHVYNLACPRLRDTGVRFCARYTPSVCLR